MTDSVYYAKNRIAILAKRRAYYAANRDRIRARTQIYQAKNAEYLKAKRQEYRANNQEEFKRRRRLWVRTLRGYFCKKIAVIKARKIGCTLTFAELEKLYIKQQGKCALTGRKLCILGKWSLDSLSLDRKNQKKGYITSNVRLVTWQANSARHIGTDVQLASFCRDVLKWSRRKK